MKKKKNGAAKRFLEGVSAKTTSARESKARVERTRPGESATVIDHRGYPEIAYPTRSYPGRTYPGRRDYPRGRPYSGETPAESGRLYGIRAYSTGRLYPSERFYPTTGASGSKAHTPPKAPKRRK
jgi:hypothetical protein